MKKRFLVCSLSNNALINFASICIATSLEMPSAGSMFKRPPGYFAGTLIDQAGLKGYTVGGAQISTKHAGFVVNVGGATAADVLQLIKDVQTKIKAGVGVELQPEVLVIGEE